MEEFEVSVVRDEDICRLAKRISYAVDEKLDPEQFLGRLEIRMKDGRVLKAHKSQEMRLEWPEIREKFLENAIPKIGDTPAVRIAEMAERMEELSDMRQLLQQCA